MNGICQNMEKTVSEGNSPTLCCMSFWTFSNLKVGDSVRKSKTQNDRKLGRKKVEEWDY